jgi:hypothetical protein
VCTGFVASWRLRGADRWEARGDGGGRATAAERAAGAPAEASCAGRRAEARAPHRSRGRGSPPVPSTSTRSSASATHASCRTMPPSRSQDGSGNCTVSSAPARRSNSGPGSTAASTSAKETPNLTTIASNPRRRRSPPTDGGRRPRGAARSGRATPSLRSQHAAGHGTARVDRTFSCCLHRTLSRCFYSATALLDFRPDWPYPTARMGIGDGSLAATG